MTPETRPVPALDVALTIRRILHAYARDFAAVVLAGFALVMLPAVLSRSISAAGDWATLVITARGVCAMLYVALVSWGVVARYSGRALPPRLFLREGLARATPGLQVALLAGAAIVVGLTVQLFSRHGTLAGLALDALLLSAGLWAACVLMPVVPAAVAERLRPMAAFRRAAALTEGNRNRIFVLALLAVLTLAPTTVLALLAGNPWLLAVVELLAWSLAATLPAVVYIGLRAIEDPELP